MDTLELFIFTYNRAESLRRTLTQLNVEPVRSCQITVLDNNSTDHTGEVCEAARAFLPKLKTIRHPKNIGGLANYLRAIELARAPYTWVICDDDSFDFAKARDIFEEIQKGESDIISAGVEGHVLPSGEQGKLFEFSLRHPFFLSHSFVPSMIFRTALFDQDCLRAGYDNIDTMFPHFPFMIRMAETNRSIYISREKVISKSNNVGYATFRFMEGWIKSCRRISSSQLRGKVINEVFGGANFIKTILFSIAIEGKFRPNDFRKNFRNLRMETARADRFIWVKLLFFWPIVAAPSVVQARLWDKLAERRRERGLASPNFDENR